MKKLNEREIIDLFISHFRNTLLNKVKKDDIVIVPIKTDKVKKRIPKTTINLILKCDMLVESTDVPEIMKPWQIARKSIVACISDLAAKGIKPYACLISIGIPKRYSKNDIIGLANGFSRASKEYRVSILGGDTNESRELIIDCNLVGVTTLEIDRIPKRYGARPGDLIVTSGKFGFPSSGLKIILSNLKAEEKFKSKAISTIIHPKPPIGFGYYLAKYFSSSIDSSDGLSSSLYELAQQSNVNFLINKVPIPKGLRHFADSNSINVEDLIFFGGEEYEIVATVPRSNFKRMVKKAKNQRIKIYVIGEVMPGNGSVFLDNKEGNLKLVKNKGFVHFRQY